MTRRREEEEKPRKKRKPTKDEEDEDEEDDDEDEDDEEGGEDEVEDEPIEWTTKKRQLNTVNIGLTAYLISFYILVVTYLIVVLVSLPWTACLAVGLFVDEFNGWATFLALCMFILLGIGMAPVYVCQIVGWITGLFSPKRAEARSICITAILLFLGPILMYIVYFIFSAAILERQEVASRMLNMFHGISLILEMLAFFCGLIYIGAIAGYMGMSMEKAKPQALGWFIVGGTMLLVLCLISLFVVPWWAKYIVLVLTHAIFYFVLSAMRELIPIVNLIRAKIVEHIKYG